LFAGCLGPKPPEPAPASPSAPQVAPWTISLDRDGLVLDDKRANVKDKESFERAVYAHAPSEPILEVFPGVPSVNVGWVVTSAHFAKLSTLKVESGPFAHEFWTGFLRDDRDEPSLTVHVVGGDVVRFRRFGLPRSATEPGTLESIDGNVRDERAERELRPWLEQHAKARDLLLVVVPEQLPFRELASSVSRVREIWPGLSTLRLGLTPISVALDAPLQQRFAAGTFPPPVVFTSMNFVDHDLSECYARSPDRKRLATGKIVVKLTIDASGAVTAVPDAMTTITDPKTIECMLSGIRTVRFPARAGAPPVETMAGFFYRR
jgi:hypothetical protein